MYTTYFKSDLEVTNVDRSATVETPEDELVEKYSLRECIDWVMQNNFERTCLQFPEHLLNDGTSIALYMQKELGKVFYILADTAYGSCCVDEIAAEHVNGDSIIHFGHACLSPVTKLPVFYVFKKLELDFEVFKKRIKEIDEHKLVIFYDDAFNYLYPKLNDLFNKKDNVSVSRLNLNYKDIEVGSNEKIICGRIFNADLNSKGSAIYIGDGDSVTMKNLISALSEFEWYQYLRDEERVISLYTYRSQFQMKKRYFQERVREANVIGILIGTLGIKNYLEAVDRIKKLVKRKGKKCYLLAVGKPNVAKLANFPEIDVFVCVACQENALFNDCKDFYRPIVSLFEVEMALGERPYSVEYTSDFRQLLPGGLFHKEINLEPEVESNDVDDSQEMMERHAGTIIESMGAQFLSGRSWQGLEQNIGQTEVCKAVKGRSGIPQGYENELATMSESGNQLSNTS